MAVNGHVPADTLLALTAAAEKSSEHPLAQAIVKAAAAKGLALTEAHQFEAVPGLGLRAHVNGQTLLAGNRKLLEDHHIGLNGLSYRAEEMAGGGQTVIHVALDGVATGLIAIADAPHNTAREAVSQLRNLGAEAVLLKNTRLDT